jgi:hypothetical protein
MKKNTIYIITGVTLVSALTIYLVFKSKINEALRKKTAEEPKKETAEEVPEIEKTSTNVTTKTTTPASTLIQSTKPPLSKGSVGRYVLMLQARLKYLSFDRNEVKFTGTFDEQTRAAFVVKYHKASATNSLYTNVQVSSTELNELLNLVRAWEKVQKEKYDVWLKKQTDYYTLLKKYKS